MPKVIKKDSKDYWDRYPTQIGPDHGGQPPDAGDHARVGRFQRRAAPAALIFTMPPGYVLPRHAHLCERFEIILEGGMTVDEMELGPGDVMIARPGEFYGPHVAGPNGCRTLEVFSTLAAAPHQLVETPDGVKPLEFGSWDALRAARVEIA